MTPFETYAGRSVVPLWLTAGGLLGVDMLGITIGPRGVQAFRGDGPGRAIPLATQPCAAVDRSMPWKAGRTVDSSQPARERLAFRSEKVSRSSSIAPDRFRRTRALAAKWRSHRLLALDRGASARGSRPLREARGIGGVRVRVDVRPFPSVDRRPGQQPVRVEPPRGGGRGDGAPVRGDGRDV